MNQNNSSGLENSSGPSTEEIRAQLDRILASPDFRRSKRLCKLLDYLVMETLAGRGERIKATSVAMDVYGRDETFDQQNDTIVRVEAGRLRHRLAEYFRDPGQHDPILIDIPKGGYRPTLTINPPHTPDQPTGPVEIQPDSPYAGFDRRLPYLTAVIAAITLLTTTWIVLKTPPGEPQLSTEDSATDVVAMAPTTKPFVMVMPLSALSPEDASSRLSLGLVESLITNLAKLSGLSVMAHASILELHQTGKPASIESIRQTYGVTHVVRGSLAQEDDTVLINVQLVDTQTGEILWVDRITRALGKTQSLEEELALQIASALSVHIQPGERERLIVSHTDNLEAWVLYRQGLVMLIPPNDMTRIHTARQLFQRATELDPEFAGGYAGESFSHAITVMFVKASEPDQELIQALTLAKKAIALDGDFGLAYAVLSFAELFAGDQENALANARKAITIQPGDAFAQFILGMNLIVAGQPETAISVLREALRLDPLESRTPYLNVLGIAYYAAGNFTEALDILEYNIARGGPRGPHMDVFVAASYGQLGRENEARSVFEEMMQDYPEFPVQAWVSNWLRREEELQKTLDVLQKLGLE